MKVIDLTQEIYTGMPVFPGHAKTVVFDTVTHEETGRALNRRLQLSDKRAAALRSRPTHVDAVSHIDSSPDAPTIDEMSLERSLSGAVSGHLASARAQPG
jgi:kynurenine formamidase